MDSTMLHALFAVCAVWSAAIIMKSIHVLRAGTPYTLSVWDGGLIRAGNRLSRVGTQVKLGVMLLLFVACVFSLASLIPIGTARLLVMGGAALSVVVDFALTDTRRE